MEILKYLYLFYFDDCLYNYLLIVFSCYSFSPNLVQVPDEEKLVTPVSDTASVHRNNNGPRKSVSIVLPSEEKGWLL